MTAFDFTLKMADFTLCEVKWELSILYSVFDFETYCGRRDTKNLEMHPCCSLTNFSVGLQIQFSPSRARVSSKWFIWGWSAIWRKSVLGSTVYFAQSAGWNLSFLGTPVQPPTVATTLVFAVFDEYQTQKFILLAYLNFSLTGYRVHYPADLWPSRYT